MKNAITLLWLLLLLQGCKKPETDAIRILPVTPEVLGFSLPGIPPGNIILDPITREVQVTIPASITAAALPASITVTDGYRVSPVPNGEPYLFTLLREKVPIQFYKEGEPYQVPVGTPYQVVARAAGPLAITNDPVSLTLGTGQPLLLSIRNYYDDAVTSTSAIVTNQLTGQSYEGSVNPVYESVPPYGRVGELFNASFDSSLPFGIYNLEIHKANNRQARANGPLTVSRGLPSAYDDWYNPPAPGARNRKFQGINLVDADQIELLLKNRTGDQYKLTPNSFAADGASMLVDIPTDLKPSQYSVQFIRKGQLVPSYSRMVISRDRSQPAVVGFYTSPNVAPDVPLVVERGKKQGFLFVISQDVEDVRLKLIPVAVGQPAVLVNVDTPRAYFIGGPDGGYPSFVLPETMKTGKYTLVLQHIMTDKRIIEGEPFERLIEAR